MSGLHCDQREGLGLHYEQTRVNNLVQHDQAGHTCADMLMAGLT